MRLGVKTLILALVVALLAVPAAFAKGGHGGGKPAWAGGGGGSAGHGKPAWAGQGKAHGRAKADKAPKVHKEKAKHRRAETESDAELTPEDLEGLNPAWYCKTLRSLMDEDGEDFYEEFGTNDNDANGFGMCVSERAEGGDPAEGVELSGDEAVCEEAPADDGGSGEEGTSEEEENSDEEETSEEGLEGDPADVDIVGENDDGASETLADDECEAAEEEAAEDGASDDGSSEDSGDEADGDSGADEGEDEAVAAFARALVSFIRL